MALLTRQSISLKIGKLAEEKLFVNLLSCKNLSARRLLLFLLLYYRLDMSVLTNRIHMFITDTEKNISPTPSSSHRFPVISAQNKWYMSNKEICMYVCSTGSNQIKKVCRQTWGQKKKMLFIVRLHYIFRGKMYIILCIFDNHVRHYWYTCIVVLYSAAHGK